MRTLLVVDIQNDFLPGGALAVPHGNEVVPVANRLMPEFDLVVATRDWHPPNHGSFARQHPGKSVGDVIDLNGLEQVLWPDHCIQDSRGAQFANSLDTRKIERVFHKGCDTGIDSYSGLFDNGHRRATGLAGYLKDQQASAVFIVGLATDYCVIFTALDTQALGFETKLILDGIRGVELHPGDCATALDEIKQAGVELIEAREV